MKGHRAARAARLLAAVGLLTAPLAPAGATPPERVRIVLVTLDTLRYDSLPASGEGPMPRTQQRALRGVRFASHRTATSTTQPTHATLLTGLHPWQHGVPRNGLSLPDRHETLAERLRSAGFETGAVIASTPLHGRFGFGQGFDHYHDSFEHGAKPRFGGVELPVEEGFYAGAESVTRQAIATLDGMEAPRQFLWVHYFDPHGPYGDTTEQEPVRLRELLASFRAADGSADALLARARELYDADVAYLDRWLDAFLERVQADAAGYPTHVVVVSDHGESFGEAGSVGHGKRLTPSQTHAPAFLLSPLVEPRVETRPVGTIDFAATLFALAGIDDAVPGGRDLTAPLEETRPVFGMRRTFKKPHEEVRRDGSVFVHDGYWFYRYDGERTWLGNSAGVVDSDHQPVEGAEAKRVRELFTRFEEDLQGEQGAPVADPETLRALEALGYVQ